MELLIFGILAVLALVGAAGVVLLKNPVHGAMALLLTLFSVAALFAVLHAEFLAVVQLLVYAGGIMVLFLFVIMLVDLEQRGIDQERGRIAQRVPAWQRLVATGFALVSAGLVGWILAPGLQALATIGGADAAKVLRANEAGAMGNVEVIGDLLYTSYLLPFELASVLLLVAMIGAVVIARRDA